MATVTLSISNELKQKMDHYHDIKWSEVFRRMILRKIGQIRKLEQLEQGGEI